MILDVNANSRKPSYDSLRLFRLFRIGSAPGGSVYFPIRWSPQDGVSFWNVAGRLEHAASTGAKRVESRGPAGLLRMALPFVGCRQRVAPRDEDIAARTLEYMTAMETAPQPEASGLEGDYRILADFNGTILAGTHSKHGIQFVTWDRDYDRTDVALRWRNTGAAEKWDRKRQSFRRNPFLASFDYFIFWQRCVIL